MCTKACCLICMIANYTIYQKCTSTAPAGYFFLSQVALAGTQIWWTTEVNLAFARLEEGYENALKDYYKKQVSLWYLTEVHPEKTESNVLL